MNAADHTHEQLIALLAVTEDVVTDWGHPCNPTSGECSCSISRLRALLATPAPEAARCTCGHGCEAAHNEVGCYSWDPASPLNPCPCTTPAPDLPTTVQADRSLGERVFAEHWFYDGGDDCSCGYWAEFDSVKRHHLTDAVDAAMTVQADRDAGQVRLTGHFCGQGQPHLAHEWQTPPAYGSFTVVTTYQCAGLLAARQSNPDATEREALAKAWDEGYLRCSDDCERHRNHCANWECDCPERPLIVNPYRRTVTTGEWTEVTS